MKRLMIILAILPLLLTPVGAAQIEAPQAPLDAQAYMPYEDETFFQGLMYILTKAAGDLMPDFSEALKSGTLIIAVALITTLLCGINGSVRNTSELISILLTSTILLGSTHSLIRLGTETIAQMDDYNKLLLPVMTTVLATSGGVTTSAALYGGTTIFSTLLTSIISKLFIPLLYIFVVLCVVNRALGEEVFQSFKQFIKWLMTWLLKIILYVFTAFITISGIASGSADAISIKAAKITISGAVPVVGGIISDASEAILVSAGVMKNAAGIYGIFAFLAICVGPVLKIMLHCFILKITSSFCGMFGQKAQCGLIDDFSQAMSLALAATGTVCLLFLISVVAFMKGVN